MIKSRVGRVFASGLGDWGSIPGRLISKTLKMVLDTTLLNTQQYKVRIKAKVEQSREWSSTISLTPQCSSYRKGSLLVTIDKGRQFYLLLLFQIRFYYHCVPFSICVLLTFKLKPLLLFNQEYIFIISWILNKQC